MNRNVLIGKLYETGELIEKGIAFAYYDLFISVVIKNNMQCIKENELYKKICNDLNVEFPISFIKYILNIGKIKGEVDYKAKEYFFTVKNKPVDSYGFDEKLIKIGKKYQNYCNKHKTFYLNCNTDEELKKVIVDNIESLNNETEHTDVERSWCKFVLDLKNDERELFDFISSVRFVLTYVDYMFYNSVSEDFSKLTVYLDTPIILSLLGFEDEERIRIAMLLLEKLKEHKCIIKILESNKNEAEFIMKQAYDHAYSSMYDPCLSNNVCKNMHDKMNKADSYKVIANYEKHLNEFGIEIDEFGYYDFDNKFSLNVNEIETSIREIYKKNAISYEPDYCNESISVDAKNIDIINRKRRGRNIDELKKSEHVLISTNKTLFYISKNFVHKNCIPQCVTMDYVISLLFLNSQRNANEYQSLSLFSICYNVCKPKQSTYKKFIELVDKQGNENILDEKQINVLKIKSLTDPILFDIIGTNDEISNDTPSEVYRRILNTKTNEYNDMEKKKNNEIDKLVVEKNDLEKKYNDSIANKEKELENLKIDNKKKDDDSILANQQQHKSVDIITRVILGIVNCIFVALGTVVINKWFSCKLLFVFIVSIVLFAISIILDCIIYKHLNKKICNFMHIK